MTAADHDGADAPRTDEQLLAAFAGGDGDAFTVLLQRHGDRLWGLALRTCGHREDAADAFQDAMVNAARGAAAFRGESSVSTWLHRVVVNACLDRHRRAASRPSTPLAPELLDGALDSVNAAHGDIADQVSARLDVERALATLPVDQRSALVLVDVLGYDVATAAAILECPVGTVKSRCARGRARLAPALAHLRNHGAPASVEPAVPTEGGELR